MFRKESRQVVQKIEKEALDEDQRDGFSGPKM